FRQSRAVRSFRRDKNRHSLRHLVVRRDLLVFAFRPCAIYWAHAPGSCGKTSRGTPACTAEAYSRPGTRDRALAVDVGSRSCETPANSPRTPVGHPPLLHKIQHGSTCASEA